MKSTFIKCNNIDNKLKFVTKTRVSKWVSDKCAEFRKRTDEAKNKQKHRVLQSLFVYVTSKHTLGGIDSIKQ